VFARREGRSRIRLHANDVPVVGSNSPMGERQISDRADVEEEHRGTLATSPVLSSASCWQDVSEKYQALTPNHQFEFIPATPERGSQRYEPRPPM